MKFKKTLTTLNQYLSYISIVLIGCAVIGMLVFWLSVRELNKSAENAERSQLVLAVNDLENQIEILEDVSDAVSSTVYYRPEYFSQTSYREVELLEHFKQFQSHSVLCKDYFLYYFDLGYFYTKDAKYTFERYFQPPRNPYLTSDADIQELQAFFRSLSIADGGILCEMENDYFLILYPIRLQQNVQRPTAVLGFVLSSQDLVDRITVSSGKPFTSPCIYYQDLPLVGNDILPTDASWDGNILAADDFIAAKSEHASFILADSVPVGGWYSGLNAYRTIIFMFLGLSMLLLVLSVIIVVRRQHAPIRRIFEKVQILIPQSNLPSDSDQLKQIEHAFDMIQQQNVLGKEQIKDQINLLNDQKTTLKQQLLLLILKGDTNQYISRQMEELDIHLTGSFFRVFSLLFTRQVPQTVLQSIEHLSDDEQHYYALQLQENVAVVLSSFLLEGTADEACDLLEAIATSQDGVSFSIGSGPTVSSFDKIPLSFYSIQTSTPIANAPEQPAEVQSGDNSWYHNQALLLTLSAIRDGNRADAFRCLDKLAEVVEQHYPSMLFQRMIIADIVSKLLQTSYELNVPIPPEDAGSLSIYSNLQSAHQDLKALLDCIFNKLDQQQEQYKSDLSLRIKKYIDDHALEYNCSLNRVAEVFNLPPKQINHYIRLSTNQTYKEYELSIRMKKAYELLTQTNLSVMQISEEIGYMDVSSFIKAFKNATGTTPGAFRKNSGSHSS